MKYCYVTFFFFIIACSQKSRSNQQEPTGKNAIPEVRDSVNKRAVASYLIPMGDARLGRKFGAEAYETNFTFKYLLVMQYDAMTQTDTLKIPNFGKWPQVKIIPGKEKLSCIIGFLDDKNNFREYKMLSAQNDQLKLTVLKSYVVSGY